MLLGVGDLRSPRSAGARTASSTRLDENAQRYESWRGGVADSGRPGGARHGRRRDARPCCATGSCSGPARSCVGIVLIVLGFVIR